MSNSTAEAPAGPDEPFGFVDLRTLTELLIRREGLQQGLFEPALKFTLVVANFKAFAGAPGGPGVLSTVDSVGLLRVNTQTPLSVDAAAANPSPMKKPRARKPAGKT